MGNSLASASSLPKEGVRADRIYERLREWIVSGELTPGERLVERSLARAMGVSRTPVREALHRLEVRGRVVHVPGLAPRVIIITPLGWQIAPS